MGSAAWVFFLEAGVALGLLVFIVWWTMFSKPDIARMQQEVEKELAAKQAAEKTLASVADAEPARPDTDGTPPAAKP